LVEELLVALSEALAVVADFGRWDWRITEARMVIE